MGITPIMLPPMAIIIPLVGVLTLYTKVVLIVEGGGAILIVVGGRLLLVL
jgi:hypothetical protein